MRRRQFITSGLVVMGVISLLAWTVDISHASGVRTLDFKNRTVQLSSGYVMLIYDLGCYIPYYKTCIYAIHAPLKYGMRLIDTASIY